MSAPQPTPEPAFVSTTSLGTMQRKWWAPKMILIFGSGLVVISIIFVIIALIKADDPEKVRKALAPILMNGNDTIEVVVPASGTSELVIINYRLASVWVNGPVKIWKVHSNGTKSLTKDREGNPLIIRPTDDRVDHGYAPYGYQFESADGKSLVASISFRHY